MLAVDPERAAYKEVCVKYLQIFSEGMQSVCNAFLEIVQSEFFHVFS